MKKITPFLWFDHQADEAVDFYLSVFKNAHRGETRYYSEAGPGPAGSVLTVEFEIEGQPFVALNGGPHYHFTPAVSFFVDCRDQAEVDDLWEKLLAGGGVPHQCGWLQDKYGISWQIIPAVLGELLQNEKTSRRAMEAMFQMVKIDIQALQAACRD